MLVATHRGVMSYEKHFILYDIFYVVFFNSNLKASFVKMICCYIEKHI